MADTEQSWDFTGLKAMYLNGTLKRSPEVSNTEGLIESRWTGARPTRRLGPLC